MAIEKRTTDPVHSVHASSIASENDRVGEVSFLNKAEMFDHPPHRRNDGSEVKPVVRLDLLNGVERHLFYGKVLAQLDQPIYVPGVEPLLTWPEVLLLAHVTILAPDRS